MRRRAWLAVSIPSLLVVAYAIVMYGVLAPLGVEPPVAPKGLVHGVWLGVHIAVSALALAVAPFQLLPRLRARRPDVHRWLGRAYVVGALVGGASGIVVAVIGRSPPLGRVGLALLGVAWLATTIPAFLHARARRFRQHRAWMLRSFAVAFAAVTFRIEVGLFAAVAGDADLAFGLASFTCWMGNLAVAEWAVHRPRILPAPEPTPA